MKIVKYIPDAITSMNLLCGTLGVICATGGMIQQAFLLMMLASVFDFCDGLAARALHAYSDLGKELDSIADMVSFGVLPSMMMFNTMSTYGVNIWCYVPLIIAVCSGIRLAKFNVDPRQSESFIGLATPACSMICGSLCYYVAATPDSLLTIWAYDNTFIPIVSIVLAILLVCELPMFSMKIKKGAPRSENIKRISFVVNVAIVAVIVFVLKLNWSLVVLISFVVYILMNIVYALVSKGKIASISCLLLMLSLTTVSSCSQLRNESVPAVRLVEEVLSNPLGAEYQSIISFDPSASKGDIVIVDYPCRAASFSDVFLNCDFYDNISGAQGGDRLPDFAGEKISTILDVANGDYASTYVQDADSTLRTLTVRAFLTSLDTACCVAPYDNDFTSKREIAKCIVLSSPYMDVRGKYDIDTLLALTRKPIPVIYPVRTAFEEAFKQTDGFFNLAVIPDDAVTSLQVYADIFKDVAKQHSDNLSACIALRSERGNDLFSNTVELYASAGMGGRMNVLVIDDPSVDVKALQKSYQRIMTVQSEKNLELRKSLSANMVFLTTLDCAARSCYALFRNNNIFTHKIAYPKASAYITKNLPGQYVLMDYDPSFLPEGLEDKLQLYVQD